MCKPCATGLFRTLRGGNQSGNQSIVIYAVLLLDAHGKGQAESGLVPLF